MSIFMAVGYSEVLNPLLPAGYDIVWSALVALASIAAIVALISIFRRRKQLTGVECVLWVAICLFIAVIGPAAWFVIGRRRERVQPART